MHVFLHLTGDSEMSNMQSFSGGRRFDTVQFSKGFILVILLCTS